jgi:hypothetical protein
MSSTAPLAGAASAPPTVGTAEVDIVVPVYNEERTLTQSIRRLHDYVSVQLPFSWRWVLADSAGGPGLPNDTRVGARDVMAAVQQTCKRTSGSLYDCQGRSAALRATAG